VRVRAGGLPSANMIDIMDPRASLRWGASLPLPHRGDSHCCLSTSELESGS